MSKRKRFISKSVKALFIRQLDQPGPDIDRDRGSRIPGGDSSQRSLDEAGENFTAAEKLNRVRW